MMKLTRMAGVNGKGVFWSMGVWARSRAAQKYALLIVMAFVLVSGVSPVAAQTPDDGPEMDLALAWEGYNRQTWWTEARITLTNENTGWQGDIVIEDKANQVTYRQPIDLPAHAYKQVRLPLFVKDGSVFTISLQNDGGTYGESRAVLKGIFDGRRVIVMADEREPFLAGTSTETDTRIWLSNLDALPETPMAWDTIDVLLLNGIATDGLTDAQRAALLAWVGAGGHLIIGGGPSLPQTLAGLPEQLQVAALGDVRILDKLHLDGNALENVAAAVLQPAQAAQPLVLAGDDAFSVRGNAGQGLIDVIGWDLAQPDGQAWLIDLWTGDPLPAIITPVTESTPASGVPTVQTLFKVPLSTLPKVWPWLVLFPVYIVLMGPGTLLLVRRLRRPVLAWVLLPVWIVGALMILALGLSSAFSRTFPLVHEVAIVTAPGDDLPARVVQGTAIYAPRIRNLSWNTTGAPRPLSGSYQMESWYNEGNAFPANARYVDGGTAIETRNPLGVVTWGVEGVTTPPALRHDLRIARQDGRLFITGELQSAVTLRNVTLLLNAASYAITLTETTPQDTPTTVSRPLTATYSIASSYRDLCGGEGDYRPYSMPAMPIKPDVPVLRDTGCYVTGLAGEVPFPATGVGGTHSGESCLIYTIPCPTQPEGRFETQLIADPSRTENGWTDEALNITYGYEPNTILYYTTPAYVSIARIEKLTLAMPPIPEAQVASPLDDVEEISLWNWTADDWNDFSPTAVPLVLTGDDARDIFNLRQGVRLRLKPKSESMTVRVVITVEGTQ